MGKTGKNLYGSYSSSLRVEATGKKTKNVIRLMSLGVLFIHHEESDEEGEGEKNWIYFKTVARQRKISFVNEKKRNLFHFSSSGE